MISPLPAPVRAAYLDACRAAVPSIVVDFRASAGVDACTRWSAWAADLVHRTVGYGHFMAEEAPEQVAAELRALLAR